MGQAGLRRVLLVCLLLLLCLSGSLAAQKKSRSPARNQQKKVKGSIGDREYTKRRNACMGDNLQPCRDQDVDIENCIMKCISEPCYTKMFPEPLEDGEVAFERVNRFKRCAKEELKAAYKRGGTS